MSTPLVCWQHFAAALRPDDLDLWGLEDVVAALIDRSILQAGLETGTRLSTDELADLARADEAYRRAAPALLAQVPITGFNDDEPATHWWWHLAEVSPDEPPAPPRRAGVVTPKPEA